MPSPPALPDELLEEIFLHLPPAEPACLMRASLASKPWLGLLTGPRFRGLYRKFHGVPPMLGFIYSCSPDYAPEEDLPHFVATTKFRVRVPSIKDWGLHRKCYAAWDCRHGRVLFSNNIIPMPYIGPLFSSETHFAVEDAFIVDRPPVFIGDTFCFMLMYDDTDGKIAILKYDLGSNCLSLIDAPPVRPGLVDGIFLMAMEDGSLGFAYVDGLTFYLSSRHMGSSGVASWTQRRAIKLETFLPIQNPNERAELIGSVEGNDTIFVTTELGIYEINLKPLRWKKIWEKEKWRALFPYMSFYNSPERGSLSDAAH